MCRQFARALGGQANPVFVVLDLANGSDTHRRFSSPKSLQLKPIERNASLAAPLS
jgi:hypothetical protein